MKKFIQSLALIIVVSLFLFSGYEIAAKKFDKRQLLNCNEIGFDPELDLEGFEESDSQIQDVSDSEQADEPVEDTEEITEDTEEEPEPPLLTADDIEGSTPHNYFKDMLFVGDSRVYGIYEYGKASGASFFSKDGLDVFEMNSVKLDSCGYEGITFKELLDKKQFKRIYFMTGLNELGMNKDKSIKKYGKWVDLMMKKQPNAQIVICANLHVSAKYEKKHPSENNEGLNYINEGIKAIAEKRNLLYVDANEIFDDEDHYLKKEYSGDGCHPYGKYLKVWAIWLSNYIEY